MVTDVDGATQDIWLEVSATPPQQDSSTQPREPWSSPSMRRDPRGDGHGHGPIQRRDHGALLGDREQDRTARRQHRCHPGLGCPRQGRGCARHGSPPCACRSPDHGSLGREVRMAICTWNPASASISWSSIMTPPLRAKRVTHFPSSVRTLRPDRARSGQTVLAHGGGHFWHERELQPRPSIGTSRSSLRRRPN